MEPLHKQLQTIGLSDKEASVYLTLLQLGSGTVHDIAKRSGVVRTTCYPLLDELEKRGLVSTTRSGKKSIYVAEPPTNLLVHIDKSASIARSLIPALSHVLSGNTKRPKIQIHEGISGVWRVYEDVIAGQEYEVKAFIPADDAISIAGNNRVRMYIRERVKKNISMRAILPKTALIEKEYTKYDKGDLRQSRFVDPKRFPMPVEIDLYRGNKIAITSFREGIGMVIESAQLYTALNSIFELCWLSSAPKNLKRALKY
jgi:HTH-type transcriptional regulator, sugar sensing transcriptional regulator